MSDDIIQPLGDRTKLSGKPRLNPANYDARAHRAAIELRCHELARDLLEKTKQGDEGPE